MKWTGPAQWTKREARAGDRLPFDRHIDDATIRLRDGARHAHAAHRRDGVRNAGRGSTRPCARRARSASAQRARRPLRALPPCRSSPRDRRFRRRVRDPVLCGHRRSVGCAAGGQAAVRERAVPDDRPPPGTRQDGLAGASPAPVRPGARGRSRHVRDLEAATASLLAGLEPYGARLLSCYRTETGELSEPLEFLSSIYNGEMRPVVLPSDGTDLGHHIPYKRISFGLDAIETAGAGGRNFSAMLSIKEYPAETRPGLIDNILRLPCELVLTETFAPADRQIARERMDRALAARRRAKRIAGPSGARCCPHATRLARAGRFRRPSLQPPRPSGRSC